MNKQIPLPEDYQPDDLVYPDVHFIFKEKNEKRMMRQEAAEALKRRCFTITFKGTKKKRR